MSYLETEPTYNDNILRLAKDPELNREKDKTSQLVRIINGFPPAEKKISRLCELSLNISKTLEKMELTLRNWAFMSLDINSANHFDRTNPDEIKSFNNNVSVRVVSSCQELTVKLNKISADMDFVTKASRSLSPREFISDSGTLLTSLTLRNIKLKDELREKISIAYSKAKLITIGTNLESMLEGGTDDQRATVVSYQHFVVSLLSQLNQAIDDHDDEEKTECLAIISDMEQMFEVFKLEYAQTPEENWLDYDSGEDSTLGYRYSSEAEANDDDSMSSTSRSTSTYAQSLHSQPLVHSITKHETHGFRESSPKDFSPKESSPRESSLKESPAKRRGSVSSLTSTNILHKSTLSEELPYLMSAFNSAKTIEEDVFHFKNEDDSTSSKASPVKGKESPTKTSPTKSSTHSPHTPKPIPATKPRLPETSLYSDSQILNVPPQSSPASYLYMNNSLLSKLGIKPQVISAPQHFESTANKHSGHEKLIMPHDKTDEENKENEKNYVSPLTKANLDSHNLTALTSSDISIDFSTDFVE